jgi:hypothetical protein
MDSRSNGAREKSRRSRVAKCLKFRDVARPTGWPGWDARHSKQLFSPTACSSTTEVHRARLLPKLTRRSDIDGREAGPFADRFDVEALDPIRADPRFVVLLDEFRKAGA